MQKVEERKIEVERRVYSFYCDGCGKFLGESEEWDDGYVPDTGTFWHNIFFNDYWYRLKKCFCPECEEKQIRKTIETLKRLGYKEEK